MYAKNTIAKRRTSGWADRRRYYRRLFALARPEALKDEGAQKAAPVSEKDSHSPPASPTNSEGATGLLFFLIGRATHGGNTKDTPPPRAARGSLREAPARRALEHRAAGGGGHRSGG